MKIINTIKNYFKNNEIKKDLSLTSIDNVLDKNSSMIYDRVMNDIKTYIDTLVRYNTLQVYDIEDTADFNCNELKLIIIGNVAYLTGRIVPKRSGLINAYEIPLPFLVFPEVNGSFDWHPVLINGEQFDMHIQIQSPNYDKIYIYFYESMGTDGIPVNLVIPLSNTYKSHSE